MTQRYENSATGALFALTDNWWDEVRSKADYASCIHIVWNRGSEELLLEVDAQRVQLGPGTMLSMTYLHRLGPLAASGLSGLSFNREFYCIVDHDEEVSCNGILFFGAQRLPQFGVGVEYRERFDRLWEVLQEEFAEDQTLKEGMLQMLLKRFVILATRLAGNAGSDPLPAGEGRDLIRRFNLLVDEHFRQRKQVSDYAGLLHKSPKTLSNAFGRMGQRSPQRIIQDRVLLEAKRLLRYTDWQFQEIAYDLGFSDASHFNRFFRKATGLNPTEYRRQLVEGNVG